MHVIFHFGNFIIYMCDNQGVGSVVGQPGTLSMLLKVLGSKPTECKLHLGAIGLGVFSLELTDVHLWETLYRGPVHPWD